MTIVIAIVALIISLGSFAFNIYQYRILHKVRVGEKATSLIRVAQDLRRKSEDLKHKIGCTDHVDDCAEFLAKVNAFAEDSIPSLVLSKDRSLRELSEIEQHLLSLEMETDLLYKQVVEVGRFNEEVNDYETKRTQRNEL